MAKTETDFDFITTQGTDIPLERIRQYVKRLGVSLGSTPDGEVFINGKPVGMSGVCYISSGHIDILSKIIPQHILQHLQVETGSQIQYLQEQVCLGLFPHFADSP